MPQSKPYRGLQKGTLFTGIGANAAGSLGFQQFGKSPSYLVFYDTFNGISGSSLLGHIPNKYLTSGLHWWISGETYDAPTPNQPMPTINDGRITVTGSGGANNTAANLAIQANCAVGNTFNGVLSCDYNAGSDSNFAYAPQVYFRTESSINTWKVNAASGGLFTLVRTRGGITTTVGSFPSSIAVNTTYLLKLVTFNNTMQLYLDNQLIIDYQGLDFAAANAAFGGYAYLGFLFSKGDGLHTASIGNFKFSIPYVL